MILSGLDPLGEAFCALRILEIRRASGAIYTSARIVQAMVDWAAARKEPGRVVDPGTGSGRFLMKAGSAFPSAALIGIDADPLAALTARANLAVAGFADRSRIFVQDYREFEQQGSSPTLYLGNPPMSAITISRRNGKSGFRKQRRSMATKPMGWQGFTFIFCWLWPAVRGPEIWVFRYRD